MRAVPCTGRQGGDRDSAGQELYVQFLEKRVRKMPGGQSSSRRILFLWKTNLIPDGEASSRYPLGVSGGLSVSPIGSGPFAQCPQWLPSLPAPPWKVELRFSHALPSQGEATSVGLPPSETQADFYPQPKLGPDNVPHGLSGPGVRAAVTWGCHSGQTGQSHYVIVYSRDLGCVEEPRGQNS